MADSVLTYLDSYCERAGQAGLLAEPLNAVTNLFFIAVAVWAARAIWALPTAPLKTRADLWMLALALFAIGIGSGLWHLVPTHTTLLLDVIPITLFINIYIIAALRRLFGLPWPNPNKTTLFALLMLPIALGLSGMAMGAAPILILLSIGAQLYITRGTVVFYWWLYFWAGIIAQITLPSDMLNGTIMYIPTYLMLVLMTVGLWLHDRTRGRVFIGAVMVWSIALFFRTVDMDFCPSLGIGTHFLWHMLNALVLWRLMRVLIGKLAPSA